MIKWTAPVATPLHCCPLLAARDGEKEKQMLRPSLLSPVSLGGRGVCVVLVGFDLPPPAIGPALTLTTSHLTN